MLVNREKMAVDKSFRRCMRYVHKRRKRRVSKAVKRRSHRAMRRARKSGDSTRRGSGWDVI